MIVSSELIEVDTLPYSHSIAAIGGGQVIVALTMTLPVNQARRFGNTIVQIAETAEFRAKTESRCEDKPTSAAPSSEWDAANAACWNTIRRNGGAAPTDKPRLDLVPWEAVEAIAIGLGAGLDKYSERAWERNPRDHLEMFAALQRHLGAWRKGEDLDPDTCQPHLAHALARLAMLYASVARGIGSDNRSGDYT